VPVQQSRTGFFKLLFQTAFKKTRSIRFNLVTFPSLLASLYAGNIQL